MVATLLLSIVLVVALTARGLRTTADLPYITHWDEPQIANTSLNMMKTGDLNPHFFNYGSLLIYLNLGVDILHYFSLVGHPSTDEESLASLDELEVGLGPDFPWYVSHPSFYAWNRFLTALFGTASVLLAYLLGKEIRDERTGLFAAFFLATLEFHIENSAYVKTDVPAAFFVLLAVWFSVRYLRGPEPWWVMAAAGTVGLAASIKYNMATGLVIPLAALGIARLSRSEGYRPWLWPAILVLPAVAFLIGTPFALFDLRTFLDHAGFEIRHYLVLGHPGFSVEPGLPHLWLNLEEMVQRAGTLPVVLAAVGLIVASRTKLGLLAFALPLLQLWLTARTRVAFHRNLLVVYPFLAVAFGVGLSFALEHGARLLGTLRSEWRRGAIVGAWCLLVLVAGHQSFHALHDSWKLGLGVETRGSAVSELNRIVEQSPDRWDKILIASELRLHPRDQRRIELPFEMRPTIELLCQPPSGALLMVGSHYRAYGSEHETEAHRINELLGGAGDPVAPAIEGAPLWLDRYSRRPAVELRESMPCTDARPLAAAPESVILIGVDTLRADRLGVDGQGRRAVSPFIDREARRGMVFTHAYATSPWTLPSFASIFTGRLPSGHGVRVVVDPDRRRRPGSNPEIRGVFGKLARSVPTLAETLTANGLTTTAVVQNPLLSPAFHLDRGFESYDHEPGDNLESRGADEVVDRALEWIDRHRRSGKKYFVFVHLFDPHLNYEAPAPFRGTFTDGIASHLELPIQGRKTIRDRIRELSVEDKAFIEAAYDEEVRFVDDQLGRLFEALEARRIWDDTLVVMTSDHGEEFFEHGSFEHGHDVFEELIRVPLIVWGPGVVPGQESTPVSIADIAPTILDALEVRPPEGMFGVSLWPAIVEGNRVGPRALLAEATMYAAEKKALIQWPHKLIVEPAAGIERLFDLEADPFETTDLSRVRPEVVRSLRETLARLSSGDEPMKEDPSLTPEMMEQLRSLGYVP